MSGLESIALAVAHLERLKQASLDHPHDKAEESNKASSASSSEDSVVLSVAKPPAPQSFSSIEGTARAISVESFASSSFSDESDSKINEPSAAALEGASKRFADILADPATWLEATENLALPAPPSEVVTRVLQDDVLCGRGGETNHHQGNIQYRNLVKAFQPLYIASKRRDKPRIAQCIVYTIRKHGGRFLKRTDARSSSWVDVGNTKAREKTSQALREGAPELRGDEKSQPQPQPQRSCSPQATAGAPPLPTNFVASPVVHHPLFHHPHHHAFHHRPMVGLTPLQQAMSRTLSTTPTSGIPIVTPIPATSRFMEHFNNNRKRTNFAATVSDGENSDGSCTSGATSPSASSTSSAASICQGPRLKRLKQRLEMQDLS